MANNLKFKKIIKRISKKQHNKEINEAVARIEKGKSVSHKDAVKGVVEMVRKFVLQNPTHQLRTFELLNCRGSPFVRR